MNKYIVYITAANKDEARDIGKALVEKKLVACVNIIPGMESIYWWEGKIENAEEVVLIAKTTEANLKSLENEVTTLHSYDCPCVIAMKIEAGNENYLKWIESSVE